jgi:hypothetical protein
LDFVDYSNFVWEKCEVSEGSRKRDFQRNIRKWSENEVSNRSLIVSYLKNWFYLHQKHKSTTSSYNVIWYLSIHSRDGHSHLLAFNGIRCVNFMVVELMRNLDISFYPSHFQILVDKWNFKKNRKPSTHTPQQQSTTDSNFIEMRIFFDWWMDDEDVESRQTLHNRDIDKLGGFAWDDDIWLAIKIDRHFHET